MKNTYQISRVAVTLPPLGIVTHDDQGNAIRLGEKYRVHLYAVKPGWEERGTFDGFMVSGAVGSGSSSSEYNITRDVIVPDGHKIIALRIGDNNQPVSWESLQVEFVGGYLSESDTSEFDKKIEAAVQALNTIDIFKKLISGKLESSYTIKVGTDKGGKRHAAGMAVGAAATKTRLYDDMRDAVIDAVRESILFAGLEPQRQVMFHAEPFCIKKNGTIHLAESIIQKGEVERDDIKQSRDSQCITVNINTQGCNEALSEVIAKAIKSGLRPGGDIHNAIYKR